MPVVLHLGRGKQAYATTHVSDCSLADAMGSATGNTGDTRDGTTNFPRLSEDLVVGTTVDGVGLSTILGDVGVYEVDNVWADGGFHDVRDKDDGGGVDGHVTVEDVLLRQLQMRVRKSSLPRVLGGSMS